MDSRNLFLFPPFRLDVRNEQLWRDVQRLTLRPKTFAVLRVLVAQAGQLVTQDALLDTVWGSRALSEAVAGAVFANSGPSWAIQPSTRSSFRRCIGGAIASLPP